MGKNSKRIKANEPEKASAKIFWAFMYLILILVIIVSSCFIFNKTYYTFFYVVGISMQPTFNAPSDYRQNYHDFGIVDSHIGNYIDEDGLIKEKNPLKQFDVLITYYPEDFTDIDKENISSMKRNEVQDNLISGTVSKIKRIIGLPGDTVTITVESKTETVFNEKTKVMEDKTVVENCIYVYKDGEERGAPIELPFNPIDRNGLTKNIFSKDATEGEKTWHLKDDEVFVMGDNWGNSKDSTKVGPINTRYVTGVLIAIQGKCKINSENKIIEKKYHSWPEYFKR